MAEAVKAQAGYVEAAWSGPSLHGDHKRPLIHRGDGAVSMVKQSVNAADQDAERFRGRGMFLLGLNELMIREEGCGRGR